VPRDPSRWLDGKIHASQTTHLASDLNNYNHWNFHPYPQRSYRAELKYDL
jgi:hypothetical protein